MLGSMTKVCIVQRRLTHYRAPLFSALRDALAERGIQLVLLVGRGTPAEEKKHDAGNLPWAKSIPTHYLAGGRLCWQPIRRHLDGASLVIVTQENKLLQNHLLMLQPRRFKLAFWGHGANLQSDNPNGLKERFKRWTTSRVDWWFAYTQMSAGLVAAAGFPDNRITVLNNAVDTSELQRQRQSVVPEETQALRESLGFGAGPVGVFVGSLYADKRLDFLFAAAEAIRCEVPDFHFLIVGEGPERDKVQAWCAANPWARWVGARFDREKAAYVSVAQVMLNPGLVGLGILDSFVCGVPMLTTDCGIHSPEIAYLENGVNGVIAVDDLNAYVEVGVRLLRDAQALDALRAGCVASAQEYTVENMAHRFADGIAHALAA
jgi:glycosyltransferase involved in cell wall biosynthesis